MEHFFVHKKWKFPEKWMNNRIDYKNNMYTLSITKMK